MPHSRTRAKPRKLVSQVLKSRNQRQARTLRNLPTGTSWNDVWNSDEWNDSCFFFVWNDDWSSVGWHEGWEQTYDTSASSFSLGRLDLCATSSPKRFEWVKMNLDTGAAVNTIPLNFGPKRVGDGRFYRDWSPDGGVWQFQGYDENGLCRSLNGKGRQDFYLGHDGGYMIPIHSKIGQGMRTHFEKLVNWHGKNELISSLSRKQHFHFLLEPRSEIERPSM